MGRNVLTKLIDLVRDPIFAGRMLWEDYQDFNFYAPMHPWSEMSDFRSHRDCIPARRIDTSEKGLILSIGLNPAVKAKEEIVWNTSVKKENLEYRVVFSSYAGEICCTAEVAVQNPPQNYKVIVVWTGNFSAVMQHG